MTLFSILTPNFNGGKKIKKCIDSLSLQNVDFEHLVMDAGSTDGSLEILENSPSVNIVSRKDNGSHDAFRKGVSASNGDIIGFLNSDDVYLPNVLERVGEIFDENPDVGAVCGECVFYQDDIDSPKFFIRHVGDYQDLFCEISIGTPCFNGWFVKKEVAMQAGNFDPDIDYSGDRDFLVRVFLSSSVYVLREPVYGYLMHQDSRTMSENRSFMLPSMYEHLHMIDNYLTNWKLSKLQRQTLEIWRAQSLIGTIIYSFINEGIFCSLKNIIKSFSIDFFWTFKLLKLIPMKIKMKKLKQSLENN